MWRLTAKEQESKRDQNNAKPEAKRINRKCKIWVVEYAGTHRYKLINNGKTNRERKRL